MVTVSVIFNGSPACDVRSFDFVSAHEAFWYLRHLVNVRHFFVFDNARGIVLAQDK